MSNPTKLDPEFKAKWLAALKSGDYKQGAGQLRRIKKFKDNSNEPLDKPICLYCCLGVAVDIIDPNGWIDDISHKLDATHLSLRNRNVAYIDNKIIDPETQAALAIINDAPHNRGSFEEVIQYIEEKL